MARANGLGLRAGFALVFSCLAITMALPQLSVAVSRTWLDAAIEVDEEVPWSASDYDDCVPQEISFLDSQAGGNHFVTHTSCLVQVGWLTITKHKVNYGDGSAYGVKALNDPYYYPLPISPYDTISGVPNTSKLISISAGYGNTPMRVSIADAGQLLHKISEDRWGVNWTEYQLNAELAEAQELLTYSEGSTQHESQIVNAEIIGNGERIMAQLLNSDNTKISYVLINTDTERASMLATQDVRDGSTGSSVVATDDNQYFFFSTERTMVWNNNCGIEVTQDILAQNKLFDGSLPMCQTRDYSAAISDKAGFVGTMESAHWEIKDQVIRFMYHEQNGDYRTSIMALSLVPGQKLDYLALGDSYSSGEGDTEKGWWENKHYRSFTDNNENRNAGIPREKCHISTRSYPYILSRGMSLGDPLDRFGTKWQTIACSGAQKYDVANDGYWTYSGQGKGGDEGGKPRLEDYREATLLQEKGLNQFIPGRQQQIEFVRRYKPRIITLTVGGNDVGFGRVIEDCATPRVGDSTCEKATPTGSSELARRIIDQYDVLKALYEQLYIASGRQAKIYVLGYPQFINESKWAACGLNVGALNESERQMIGSGTKLMNNVIRQAARAAGVKYVDIESSLNGGRLCDSGQKYVTGITNLLGWNGNEMQESFHPNDKGHFQMAMTVWDRVNNESLLEYDTCPTSNENLCPSGNATKENIEIPAYFGSISSVKSEYADLTSDSIRKSTLFTLATAMNTFLQDSIVRITIHSDPIVLGDFPVDGNGSLVVEGLVVPNTLPAGYHTIVVSGEDEFGEPIKLEQIILIEGPDPSDIDENGILDSRQVCGPFLVASGQDEDGDGIDDACDPMIEQELSSSTHNTDPDSANIKRHSNTNNQEVSELRPADKKDVTSNSNNFKKSDVGSDNTQLSHNNYLALVALGIVVIIVSMGVYIRVRRRNG